VPSSFLKNFFSVVKLPAATTPDVLAVYGRRYARSLANNPSISGFGAHLFSGLSAYGIAELVSSGSPRALEAILSGTESRDTITQAVLEDWDLSKRDQLRLTKRPLAKKTATTIVRGPYVTPAKLAALPHASPDAQIEWVARHGSDQAAWDALEVLAPVTKSLPTLVACLLLRPKLRDRALASDCENLAVAACWTELPARIQPFAGLLAISLAPRRYNTAFDPMVGLLNQPGLSPKVRASLITHLKAEKDRCIAENRNTIHTKSLDLRLGHIGVPTRKCADPAHLDMLLKAASRSTGGSFNGRERAVTTTLLYDLSLNIHLSTEQIVRLAQLLCWHADLARGSHHQALRDALVRVSTKLNGITVPLNMPNRQLPAQVLHEIQEVLLPPSPATRTASKYKTRAKALRYGVHRGNETSSSLQSMTIKALGTTTLPSDPYEPRLKTLSPVFARSLGDATTALSLRSWMLFLGLCENDPAVPLSSVLKSAKRLARAELGE
jgi:predicted component of type VI protein secretion system